MFIYPPQDYVLLHLCSFYNTVFLSLWIVWSPYPQWLWGQVSMVAFTPFLSQWSRKVCQWTGEAGVRSHCFSPALPPFEQNSAAELCTHSVFHTSPLPCYYFILGHQQIEAVFQLFPNISSCMKRTPVQRHTQWAPLCCPPCILLPTGDFQHDPFAPWHDFVPVWQGGWVDRDRVIYRSPLWELASSAPSALSLCSLPL